MKIHYEPIVHKVGFSIPDCEDLEKFLCGNNAKSYFLERFDDDEMDCSSAESMTEVAGRLCYMSFNNPRPGGNKAYIDHIKEVGHGSVLEHASWNFIFEGISRTLTHELVRHRAGMAYSQLSQRYVDESVCEVVAPHDLREEIEQAMICLDRVEIKTTFLQEAIPLIKDKRVLAGMEWLLSISIAYDEYRKKVAYLSDKITKMKYRAYVAQAKQMREPESKTVSFERWLEITAPGTKTEIRKGARQAARSVLPNATETKIFVTMNARAARHFIEMRASRHAEPEIRKLAYKVWQSLKDDSPNIFGDYKEVPLTDGTVELTTPTRKV